MRLTDFVGGALIVSGAVLYAGQALGQEAVPAQIVVEPVPTPVPPLGPLRVPRVAFAPSAVTALGPDGLPIAGSAATPAPANMPAAQSTAIPVSIVGTVSYKDKRMSYATIVDGAGFRKVYVGDVLAGAVITDIGDGSITLANGQILRISAPTYSVPGISSNSFGAQTVPVNLAPSSATPTPAAMPATTPAPRPPFAAPTNSTPVPAASAQPVQVLNPITLPTPQTAAPESYPTPQALLPTGDPQHA